MSESNYDDIQLDQQHSGLYRGAPQSRERLRWRGFRLANLPNISLSERRLPFPISP